nr:DNA-directed RNA polymerase, mitochondrial-like [Ciona intestinalis]|eukprot:XP_002124660.1 DNA-directed RNA polymerase, mitochondrial-like [Ciona intestinalis]
MLQVRAGFERNFLKFLRRKNQKIIFHRKLRISPANSGLTAQASNPLLPHNDDSFHSFDGKEILFEEQYAEATHLEPKKPTIRNKYLQEMSTSSKFLLNYVETCAKGGYLDDAVATVIDKLDQSAASVDDRVLEFIHREVFRSTNLRYPPGGDAVSPFEINLILFEKMKQTKRKPSAASCAYILASLQKFQSNAAISGRLLTRFTSTYGYSCLDILDNCRHDMECYNSCELAITSTFPGFKHSFTPPLEGGSDNPLTQGLGGETPNTSIRLDSVNSKVLKHFYEKQLQQEIIGKGKIPNVLNKRAKVSKSIQKKRDAVESLHSTWKVELLRSFQQLKVSEEDKWTRYRKHRFSGVYPFLCVLPPETFVDIIIQFMMSMSASGNIASVLCYELGSSVYSHHLINQLKHDGYFENLRMIYSDYTSMYTHRCNLSPRQSWLQLEDKIGNISTRHRIEPWHNMWLFTVGLKLLEVMVSTLTFNLDWGSGVKLRNIPAVFNSYKVWGGKMYGMAVPHPGYVAMLSDAKHDFEFETGILPMVVPPLPWVNPSQGGYLASPTKFVRSYRDVIGQEEDTIDQSDVTTVMDSLNILGSVGWKINQRVLDVQLCLFRNNGDKKLSIPPPATSAPKPPDLSNVADLPPNKRGEMFEAARAATKLKLEMNSLHADGLYKLSIADYYRDDIVWFPHNLDFRGRTYPVSRHLNYMGSDVSRSLFLFADGKPLGGDGLNWLKIHLVNLTGEKKKEGMAARLDYANEMMDEILDSADRPLDGRCWWKESDEPWQTLAACFVLADALRTRNPEDYVCNLPVYQDGSCNGLQHYAALGRDTLGAQQVNLAPSSVPQDIYAGVAAKVENIRSLDADRGSEVAKVLEGFVTRQVVKQTVMTTVYGVTRYGGVLQVQRQLLYLDDFPRQHSLKGAMYLVDALFQSINEIFTGASHIQKWFTDIARCVSRGGNPVEWETPLGLRVVQPYHSIMTQTMDTQLQRINFTRATTAPNVMKQTNAFPPNFIHSLDSTHMMLTALYCHKFGIKFSAVHDCYWTHACDVDIMNVICREQFVKLHSQPILEKLASHLKKFLKPAEPHDITNTLQEELLLSLLNNVPTKGDFDLNQVKNSVFFFS